MDEFEFGFALVQALTHVVIRENKFKNTETKTTSKNQINQIEWKTEESTSEIDACAVTSIDR